MKKTFFLFASGLIVLTTFGQDPASTYKEGVEKAQAGKFEEAIALFSKTIELQPENYFAWYNRGIARSRLNNYEEALTDFEQVVVLKPDYKKGYLNRGVAKRHLTDYNGAISDYSYSITLDPNYADAFYNRALVYEMLEKKDSACLDFNKAKENGIAEAQRKIDKCKDPAEPPGNYHSILALTKTSDDKKYGFTPENPVKCGFGPNGGPANQQAYLELLRDSQGKPIKYVRLGSCCMYDTPNGLMGKGMLDQYEITFKNESGKDEKVVVYMTFDDYQELKVLYGFKTVGQK